MMTGPPWPGSQIHPGEAPASRRWTSVGSFPSWQKAFIVSRSSCQQEIGDECFLQLTAGLEELRSRRGHGWVSHTLPPCAQKVVTRSFIHLFISHFD